MSPGHGAAATNLRTHDGLRLHVEVTGEGTGTGDPGDRPDVTVVLAHGWTQSIQTWRYQARDLPR
ncbi:MAG: hypothetical protein M3165_00065, partial [Actinomycetota bacterium]|nr:hypothetical protein [Actinomycetota bacterium]